MLCSRLSISINTDITQKMPIAMPKADKKALKGLPQRACKACANPSPIIWKKTAIFCSIINN
jgi:hypothetical protein